MTEPHITPIRVYYEDTDAGGIVYYANYLKFAERARSEMMREVGIESSQMMDEHGVALTVKTCHVDYKKPARLDDELEVHSRITKIGGASLVGEQHIKKDGQDMVVIGIKLACMAMDGKPARLPQDARAKITTLLQE